MPPLLKNLLGSGSKDREMTDEMRGLLEAMQQERAKIENLLTGVRTASENLQNLSEPIIRANNDMDAVTSRLGTIEQRFHAMTELLPKFEAMSERLDGLVEGQQRAEAQVVQALEQAKQIMDGFEDVGARVQQAVALKDRIENFLELEKPFQQVRDDVGALRGQVDGTGEQLTKLREQHDRLLDAHKMATTKQEALDRRREELSRDLQDKERRVANVSQAVRGLDGVQATIEDLRRQIGTLKALGDFVGQKSAALEAQREAVENALARAQSLDRAMSQIDAGIRQQQANENALTAMQDEVTRLQSLHETVVSRSREIADQQRETDEQARGMRADLVAAQDEHKQAVERFDFETRGLESVSQRVTDVRGALSDFELRFKGLAAASQSVASLLTQTQSLSGQVGSISAEVNRIHEEAAKLANIRRELDDLTAIAQSAAAKVARIEESRPAVEAALRDVEQLRGAHALVHDAVEQVQNTHQEIVKVRASQADAKQWLAGVEHAVETLRAQVEDLHAMQPVVERAQRQTQTIGESMDLIQSRQAFIEELKTRLTSLATLGDEVDARGRQLATRMDAAEQRFTSLATQANEAETTARHATEATSALVAAQRTVAELGHKIAAVEGRCESIEALTENSQSLHQELVQRNEALESAKRELQRASTLRQEAAASAQQLDALAKQLGDALASAENRVTQLDGIANQLEHRANDLKPVENRLDGFEERMAKWNLVEQDVARSLETLSTRQGTVDALHADLDRMFAMAEKTANEVRGITSAQREIEDGRKLLDQVRAEIDGVNEIASALDERKRQLDKAEERLSRTEALLVDVRSSFDALQGQKVIVDQAVEKSGSLTVLVKQAEAMVASLREEREVLSRVRSAVGVDRDDEAEDEDMDGPVARAA